MKKILAVAIALSVALTLSGCGGESWEELAENKERCEDLGGTFNQWEDGLYGGDHSSCDFDGDEFKE